MATVNERTAEDPSGSLLSWLLCFQVKDEDPKVFIPPDSKVADQKGGVGWFLSFSGPHPLFGMEREQKS